MFRRNAVRRHEDQMQVAERLTMQSERDERGHMVALTGSLDLASAAIFEQELKRVEATDAPAIIVDLGGLTSIDSVGLKTIIHADVRSRDSGRLTLVGGSEDVQRTFETTGLATRLAFKHHVDAVERHLH